MKSLLIVLSLVLSASLWAQDPILTDMDWYLSSLVVDGETFEAPAPDPTAGPTLTFFESNGEYEMTTFITEDSFFAKVDIDQGLGTLTTSESGITLLGCILFCDLEKAYFQFLFKDGTPVTFNYIISIVDAPEDATYFLEIIDSEGNTAFYQNKFLSVPEQQQIPVIIYPNPARDYIQIASSGPMPDSVRILSFSGKELGVWEHTSEGLDVSALPAGMYFLELTSAQGKQVQKFIKH